MEMTRRVKKLMHLVTMFEVSSAKSIPTLLMVHNEK